MLKDITSFLAISDMMSTDSLEELHQFKSAIASEKKIWASLLNEMEKCSITKLQIDNNMGNTLNINISNDGKFAFDQAAQEYLHAGGEKIAEAVNQVLQIQSTEIVRRCDEILLMINFEIMKHERQIRA